MAGRPKKTTDTVVAEKPKKTGVPKMTNPPPPPKAKVNQTEAEIEHEKNLIKSIKADENVESVNHNEQNRDITIVSKPQVIEFEKDEDDIQGEIKPLDKTLVEVDNSIPQEKNNVPDKPKQPDMEAIIKKYDELCEKPSDINQLLPYLRAIAEQVDTIVEFGVRQPTSTYALLAGNPKSLTSYDIYRDPLVDEVEAVAPNFKFVLGSSLEVEIEECDFAFFDTVHTYTQLERELTKHGNKAKRFLGFHDTTSFENTGEGFYPGPPSDVWCGRGIWGAIENFLRFNPHWKIDFRAYNNNGLTILRRWN